jgi:hypothetical protein
VIINDLGIQVAADISERGSNLITRYALSNVVADTIWPAAQWASNQAAPISASNAALSNALGPPTLWSSNQIQPLNTALTALSNASAATYRRKDTAVPWSDISGAPAYDGPNNSLAVGGAVLGAAGLALAGTVGKF